MKVPLIKRIVIFGILSSTISLVLAFFIFGIVEYSKLRSEATSKIKSQMDVLAYNLQSVLLFDDYDAAYGILKALESDKVINRVIVYKNDGKPFASFIRTRQAGDLQMTRYIFHERRPIGWLKVDFIVGITDKYMTFLWISLLIILLSIPASYVISSPIRKSVSAAILQMMDQSQKLRLLADQVVTTEQSERKRIAAIIHDHLQQLLVAAKLQLGLVNREIEKGEAAKARVSLNRAEGFVMEATQAAKTLTVELRPPVLYEDGLGAAFQWLAKKFTNDHNLNVNLQLDDIPVALTDTLKILIFEAVRELLLNVVKYADVNTVDLTLKYESNSIKVIVKDKGRGFNVAQKEQASLHKGFGLFSIRERLNLLNGVLNVSSTPGVGTEIEVIVPVSVQASSLQKTIAKSKDIPIVNEDEKINLLVADDHAIVREGIANLLNENPLLNVVAQAENGLDALEKVELFRPDVVIMDINMPKLNGIEATRAIKKKFSDIDIIGLSVLDEKGATEAMKKAGAVTLLNKAGDPQELVRTILACKWN